MLRQERRTRRSLQLIRHPATTAAIAELGNANASLTEITLRAGVSKGLLWHYFQDRDDLMKQAVSYLADRLRAGLVAHLDLSAPVPDVIRAVFVRSALFTRTHPEELEALDQIVNNLRASDGRRRITMADYDGIYAEHAALLSRGQREGTIRRGDVQMLAVGYQALIDGLIGHLQAHPEDDPPALALATAEVFLQGAALSVEPAASHVTTDD